MTFTMIMVIDLDHSKKYKLKKLLSQPKQNPDLYLDLRWIKN